MLGDYSWWFLGGSGVRDNTGVDHHKCSAVMALKSSSYVLTIIYRLDFRDLKSNIINTGINFVNGYKRISEALNPIEKLNSLKETSYFYCCCNNSCNAPISPSWAADQFSR